MFILYDNGSLLKAHTPLSRPEKCMMYVMKIYDDDDDKHDEMEIYFVSPIPYPYSNILFYPITISIRRLLSYPILSYPSKSKDE